MNRSRRYSFHDLQNRLVGRAGLTVTSAHAAANHFGFRMPGRTIELPKSGFALEIDGRLKTETVRDEKFRSRPVERVR
jgi:hypothetical protein